MSTVRTHFDHGHHIAHREDYDGPGSPLGTSRVSEAAAVHDLYESEILHSADEIATMQRLLHERDRDLDYACQNDRDDTGYIAPVALCGCEARPFVECEYHTYISEELESAE